MFDRFESLDSSSRYKSRQLAMMNHWLLENGLYNESMQHQWPRGTLNWPFHALFPINILEDSTNASENGVIPLTVQYRFAGQGLTSSKWFGVLFTVQQTVLTYSSASKEWKVDIIA